MDERIFKLEHGFCRHLNLDVLTDGQWWVLDFGTAAPGITSSASVRTGGEFTGRVASLAGALERRYGLKMRRRSIPMLDHGDDQIKYMIKTMTGSQYYEELQLGRRKTRMKWLEEEERARMEKEVEEDGV